MINIIGGGGSGKTTLSNSLIEMDGFTRLLPYTTRKKRPGEVDEVDYRFISKREYQDFGRYPVY